MNARRLVRGSLVAGLFALVSVVFSYAFRILVARNSTIEQYGLFFALFSFLSLFLAFIDLGTTQAVVKKTIDHVARGNRSRIKGILLVTTGIQFGLSALIALGLFFTRDGLVRAVFGTDDSLLFLLMLVWFATMPIVGFLEKLFQGFQKVHIGASFEPMRHVLATILAGLFFASSYGARSPALAYACINLLMLVIYAPLIKRAFPDFFRIKTTIVDKDLKEIARYAVYISFTGFLTAVITQTDTLMVTIFSGVAEAGLYQTAMPLANGVLLLNAVFVVGAFPILTGMFARNQTGRGSIITQVYVYALVLALPAVVLIHLFAAPLLTITFGAEYVLATPVLRLAAFCGLFAFMTSISNNLLVAMGKPDRIARNMVLAALLNVLLNLTLIPRYGAFGAVIATLIGFLCSTAISFRSLRATITFDPPPFLRLGLATLALYAVTALLLVLVPSRSLPIGALIAGTGGIVYISTLMALRIVRLQDIRQFISFVRK